jgi:hypothetical protein
VSGVDLSEAARGLEKEPLPGDVIVLAGEEWPELEVQREPSPFSAAVGTRISWRTSPGGRWFCVDAFTAARHVALELTNHNDVSECRVWSSTDGRRFRPCSMVSAL